MTNNYVTNIYTYNVNRERRIRSEILANYSPITLVIPSNFVNVGSHNSVF